MEYVLYLGIVVAVIVLQFTIVSSNSQREERIHRRETYCESRIERELERNRKKLKELEVRLEELDSILASELDNLEKGDR